VLAFRDGGENNLHQDREDRRIYYGLWKRGVSEQLGVSIIVVNYNNERFLAPAIESALGQNYPLCEVIVVDDCSTDNSRAVIARYGDRIRTVLRETNGGQTKALNCAWSLACYPILIFLDSDDLLLPHAAATIAARWSAETVKIQAPLVAIDAQGREVGHISPQYPRGLDTATIRAELLRTGGAPNSPASGNAYSRSLLELVTRDGGFDLDNPRDLWMDTILICNAPFYGEVLTLSEPFACYRTHEKNLYRPRSVKRAHFVKLLNYGAIELEYFAGRCQRWGIPFDPVAARARSLWLLECQLIADKLASTDSRAAKDQSGETIFSNLYRALRVCIGARLKISSRIIRAVWLLSVVISPRSVATRIIALRFVSEDRPAGLGRMLAMIVDPSLRRESRARYPGVPSPRAGPAQRGP
jgi:glycosyltransferase involved in cell wall biosynthesis